jgi:hypothetical protein
MLGDSGSSRVFHVRSCLGRPRYTALLLSGECFGQTQIVKRNHDDLYEHRGG